MSRCIFQWRAALVATFFCALSIAAVGETIKSTGPEPTMASARHRLAVALRRKAFGDRLVRRRYVAGVERKETVTTATPTSRKVAYRGRHLRMRRRINARWTALAHKTGWMGRHHLQIAHVHHRTRPPVPAATNFPDETRAALGNLGPSAREGQLVRVRVFSSSGVDKDASAVFLGELPGAAPALNPLNCWGQPVLFVRRSSQRWSRAMVCDSRPAGANEWASQIYYGGLVATQ